MKATLPKIVIHYSRVQLSGSGDLCLPEAAA